MDPVSERAAIDELGDQILTALELSRVDEIFQEAQWGVDAEAAERTARLRVEAAMLDRWFRGLAAGRPG